MIVFVCVYCLQFALIDEICHIEKCFVGHRVDLQADAKIFITRVQFDF